MGTLPKIKLLVLSYTSCPIPLQYVLPILKFDEILSKIVLAASLIKMHINKMMYFVF